jgi:molybdopterin-guanine dinucleotide biosynthesis protein A
MRDPTVVGIFVGGASTRMGGRPKGLLERPDGQTLVSGLIAASRTAGLAPMLVGAADAYDSVEPDVRRIADDPRGIGPLGGLAALLVAVPRGHAIAVACDMPNVDAAILSRVANDPSPCAVIAPRRSPGAPWEPLLARYDAARVRPVLERALSEGVRSFQALFERLDVAALPVDEALGRALADWDTPADLSR